LNETADGLDVCQFTLAPGVRAAFTGRGGGLSQPPYDTLNMGAGSGDSPATVARNRELAAAACGLTPDRMIWMRQIHSADVACVPGPAEAGILTVPARAGTTAAPPAQPPAPRDASFTSVPGLALGVLSADCPAVLIADPQAKIVGAAHSGRQGTARGVVPALVHAMTAAGADPARMHAVIGPGICGACYEVPAPMRDEVDAAVPGSGCLTRAGTPGLDLLAGITGQLAALGVHRVRADERCTAEEPALYSYRRDGRTGRFAGLVWLAP
jgi:YfiH family protein